MSDPYTYYAESIPDKLRFASLRHHCKLIGWTFFQFSWLKYYLWRALRSAYNARDLGSLITSLRQQEIYNVLAMSVLHGVVGGILLCATVSLIQSTPIQWLGLLLGSLGGLILSLVVAYLLYRTAGLAVAIALGSVLFSTVIPAFGCSGGIQPGIGWFVVTSLALGFAVSTPLGAVRALLTNDTRVQAYGICGAVAAGLAAGIQLSALFFMPPHGALGAFVMIALLLPIFLAGTRLIMYPFELLWIAILQVSRPQDATIIRLHPATWDELMIPPGPGLHLPLSRVLENNINLGFATTRQLVANAFQRWIVQRAFADLARRSPNQLRLLYMILEEPHFRECGSLRVIVEMEEGVTDTRSARAVVLAEIGGVFASTSPSQTTQEAAYFLTYSLRDRRATSIQKYSGLLYHLLDENLIASSDFSLSRYQSEYESILSLEHGSEISQSFSAIARFLEWHKIENLAAAAGCVIWVNELADVLRPGIIQTLKGLAEIASEIEVYQASTSRVNQLSALSRATAGLDVLLARVSTQTHLPENVMLLRVIRQWQSLIAQASGTLGREALRELLPHARQANQIGGQKSVIWQRPLVPIANPYRVGEPVSPPLFVGRRDVFDRICGVWSIKEKPDSIILYGHRRMGKTSILRNLEKYAPPGSLLVYADLKGEAAAFARGTHDLLRGVAEAVVWQAQKRKLLIASPRPEDYNDPAAAAYALRRLLRETADALPAKTSLILAMDEFETVDDGVQAGKIGQEIYDYLRSLSHEPRITLVFAGLHTLDEMSRDYRQAFFGSYTNIRVSYLSPEAARQLITHPTLDFQVDYDPQVVERIIYETRGQPLLVQSICQELIGQLNHELFDLEKDREVRVLMEDLEAVLSDEFVLGETRYFDGIWKDQVVGKGPVESVLRALVQGPAAVETLLNSTGLAVGAVSDALNYLKMRDLATIDSSGRWALFVPLMRRWLQLRPGPG